MRHVLLQSETEVSLYALARTVELSKPKFLFGSLGLEAQSKSFALSIHPRPPALPVDEGVESMSLLLACLLRCS